MTAGLEVLRFIASGSPGISESRPPHRLCPSSRPDRHLSHEISCWLEKATFLGSFPGVTWNQPQKETGHSSLAGLRSRGFTRRLGLGAAGRSSFPYLPESKSIEALVGVSHTPHPDGHHHISVLAVPSGGFCVGKGKAMCVPSTERWGRGRALSLLAPRSDSWIEPAAPSS